MLYTDVMLNINQIFSSDNISHHTYGIRYSVQSITTCSCDIYVITNLTYSNQLSSACRKHTHTHIHTLHLLCLNTQRGWHTLIFLPIVFVCTIFHHCVWYLFVFNFVQKDTGLKYFIISKQVNSDYLVYALKLIVTCKIRGDEYRLTYHNVSDEHCNR
jgi:hypothetical protein